MAKRFSIKRAYNGVFYMLLLHTILGAIGLYYVFNFKSNINYLLLEKYIYGAVLFTLISALPVAIYTGFNDVKLKPHSKKKLQIKNCLLNIPYAWYFDKKNAKDDSKFLYPVEKKKAAEAVIQVQTIKSKRQTIDDAMKAFLMKARKEFKFTVLEHTFRHEGQSSWAYLEILLDEEEELNHRAFSFNIIDEKTELIISVFANSCQWDMARESFLDLTKSLKIEDSKPSDESKPETEKTDEKAKETSIDLTIHSAELYHDDTTKEMNKDEDNTEGIIKENLEADQDDKKDDLAENDELNDEKSDDKKLSEDA